MRAGLNIGDAAQFSAWAPLQQRDSAAASPVSALRPGASTAAAGPSGGQAQGTPAALGSYDGGAAASGSQPGSQRRAPGWQSPGSTAWNSPGGSHKPTSQLHPGSLLPPGLSEADLTQPPLDSDDDVRPGDSYVPESPACDGQPGGSQRSVQGGGSGPGTSQQGGGSDDNGSRGNVGLGSQQDRLQQEGPGEPQQGEVLAQGHRKRRRASGAEEVVIDLT